MTAPKSESLEISPQQLRRLATGPANSLAIVDVRTDAERAIATLPDTPHIPMDQTESRLDEYRSLAENADLVILCHHGVRSLAVARWLRAQGLERAWSLAGGLDRWSLEIDPSIPRY
jgi:rhodanese-related sulfurtransferase